MNTDQKEVTQRIQSNRHLKEWSNNIANEINARYALSGKHKQESSCLRLSEFDVLDQTVLARQQSAELTELKQQHSETRIAIQQRHSQEKTDFIYPGVKL